MNYKVVVGVGVDITQLDEYFNKNKAKQAVIEVLSDYEEYKSYLNKYYEAWGGGENFNFDNFDVDSFLQGTSWSSIGEFLTEFDRVLYWDYIDESEYLFYGPTYPWDRTSNEPKSYDEAINRIYIVLSKIYDLSREDFNELVQDIYEADYC